MKEQNWTTIQNNLTARIHLKRNNPLLSEKELICPQLPPRPPPPQLPLQHRPLHQPNQPNPIPQLSLNELELPLTLHDDDKLHPEEEEEVETLALLEEEDCQTHPEEEDLPEELDHRQSPLHK